LGILRAFKSVKTKILFTIKMRFTFFSVVAIAALNAKASAAEYAHEEDEEIYA